MLWIDDDRIAVMGQESAGEWVNTRQLRRNGQGVWSDAENRGVAREAPGFGSLATARVEVGERRQRFISVNGREVDVIDDTASR